jgi:DNA repair protein RadC
MHEGHRDRLRQAYIRGSELLEDHQLLELMLGYAIPRRDTNPIAHELMKKFRNLRGVLQAEIWQLQQVEGVGERTAIFLKSCLELAKRCQRDPNEGKKMYDTLSKLAEYFCPLFFGLEYERVYAMYLDNGLHMIDCVLMSEGTYNMSPTTARRFTQLAYDLKASNVVIAHNHPNGIAVPSSQDVMFTDSLRAQLEEIEVFLLDHLVIVENRYRSIMEEFLTDVFAKPKLKNHKGENFYKNYYDNGTGEGSIKWKL